MKLTRSLSELGLVVVVLTAGCAAPPSAPTSQSSAPSAARATTPQRMTIAIRGNPPVLAHKLNIGNNFIGTQQLERLVNAGLTVPDTQDVLHPQLADAVPTLENGLWQVFADGRMETTWRLQPKVRWHDGAPLTTEDVLFAATV